MSEKEKIKKQIGETLKVVPPEKVLESHEACLLRSDGKISEYSRCMTPELERLKEKYKIKK